MAFLDLAFPFQPLLSVPRGPPHVTLCHLAEAGGHPMCREDAERRPAPGSVGNQAWALLCLSVWSGLSG